MELANLMSGTPTRMPVSLLFLSERLGRDRACPVVQDPLSGAIE